LDIFANPCFMILAPLELPITGGQRGARNENNPNIVAQASKPVLSKEDPLFDLTRQAKYGILIFKKGLTATLYIRRLTVLIVITDDWRLNMKTAMLKLFLCSVVALFLGLIGFSFIFSDTATGESGLGRVVTIIIIFFISGLIIGYIVPRFWGLAGLTAWAGILFGLLVLFRGSPGRESAAELQTLDVAIADGDIELSSSILNGGDLNLIQENCGDLEHELAIYRITEGTDLEILKRGDFQDAAMRASLPPVGPGETDSAVFKNIFTPGRYVIFCARETDNGLLHMSTGEIAQFQVR